MRHLILILIFFIACKPPTPPEVVGCMDTKACNYNDEATMNDPDYPCTYPEINQDL